MSGTIHWLHYTTLHHTTLHYTGCTTLRYTNCNCNCVFRLYTTLAYITRYYTTMYNTTTHISTQHWITLHCTNYTTPQLQLQLHLRYTHYTTLQLQLHYSTVQPQLRLHTIPNYIQQLWVRWPLQPLHPLKKHISNHPSIHQWIRSAIHASQHLTSPIQCLIFETSAAALCGITGKQPWRTNPWNRCSFNL